MENVNTEVKRTTPVPRDNIQSLLNQQKVGGANANMNPTIVQSTDMQTHMPGVFDTEENKLQFKKALRSQEDRLQKILSVQDSSPTLELKVSVS